MKLILFLAFASLIKMASAAELVCGFTGSADNSDQVSIAAKTQIVDGHAREDFQYGSMYAFDVFYSAYDESLTVSNRFLDVPGVTTPITVVSSEYFPIYYHNYYSLYDPNTPLNVFMTCFVSTFSH